MRAMMLVLSGCSFHPGSFVDAGLTGDVTQTVDMVDASIIESATWSFDTAADFTRSGSALGAVGVEPWGALTSGAYVPGGVIVRGINQAVWNAGMTDAQAVWAASQTLTPDGIGMWRMTDVSDAFPVTQFGIVDYQQPFALWIEGEMWIGTAGTHELWLDGDDIAFLDLAAPGSSQFSRVVTSRWTVAGTQASYTAAAPGWYPFRLGFGQGVGNIRLSVWILPQGGVWAQFDRTTLRARADGLRGMQRTAFDQQLLTDAREVIGLERGPFLTTTFAQLPPGISSSTSWSARWTGQFYVQTPGSYTFRALTDDGNHVVIPGDANVAAWSYNAGNGSAQTDSTATLEAGWNELVVDYNQVGGGHSAAVTITAAPEAALIGAPIPESRLRPVEDQRARAIPNAATGVNATIVDNTSAAGGRATATFDVRGVAGEVVGLIDVVIHADEADWNDLNVEVLRPDGTAFVLCNNCLTGSGNGYYGWETTNAAIVGGPPGGQWRVRVWDDQGGGGDGTLIDAYLTVRVSGGMPTVATDALWTSEIVDLGAATLLDITSVTWTARTPRDPADVEVRMRACSDAACSGEAWSPTIANGAAPALTAGRRYLQSQVRLLSDGLRESELQQLVIVYRTLR